MGNPNFNQQIKQHIIMMNIQTQWNIVEPVHLLKREELRHFPALRREFSWWIVGEVQRDELTWKYGSKGPKLLLAQNCPTISFG